jgi:HAD superfamily hydrolase (TIGR01509 family)
MDGLLVDSEPLYKSAWQNAAREVGIELSDAVYDTLVGRTEADSEIEMIAVFGETFPIAEFRTRWDADWRAQAASGQLLPMAGARDLLETLRERGVPLALATSSRRVYTTLSLAATDLDSYFDAIVTVDQVTRGKPAPDLYLLAAEKLGLSPASCVALEDSDAGASAAVAAGMRVFVIPDLVPPSAQSLAGTAGVFESLELATPAILQALGCEIS